MPQTPVRLKMVQMVVIQDIQLQVSALAEAELLASPRPRAGPEAKANLAIPQLILIDPAVKVAAVARRRTARPAVTAGRAATVAVVVEEAELEPTSVETGATAAPATFSS